MKVLCQIEVTLGDAREPVVVQVEESDGVLSLREVVDGTVIGSQIEAGPEVTALSADRYGWNKRQVTIGVRSAP